MQALFALALATIACVLFYRLVERRHKVLLAKIVLGVLAFVVLGVVAAFVSDDRRQAREEARRRGLKITFIRDTLSPRGREPGAVFRLCNRSDDTVTSVSFRPVSTDRGRSTEHPLIEPVPPAVYVSEWLESDYILSPSRCVVLTWAVSPERRFLVRDTVFAQIGLVSVREH